MEKASLYIDGALKHASSGETFTSYNPATGEPLAVLGLASAQDVQDAIDSAQRGFAIWSAM